MFKYLQLRPSETELHGCRSLLGGLTGKYNIQVIYHQVLLREDGNFGNAFLVKNVGNNAQ